MSRKVTTVRVLVVVNVLLLVCNVGWFLHKNTEDNPPTKDASSQYPFLSKRLFIENQNDILINFVPLRQAMNDYIKKQDKGKISLYFEYLPSGISIGVNDQQEVKLASLVKLPIVMAVYKNIEDGSLPNNKELVIGPEDIDKNFGTMWQKGAGAKITVNEAIDATLIDSDNTATRVLTHAIKEGSIDDVFDSLDIPKVHEPGFSTITPKNYTSIFRSLYLSSYLTREHSSEILDTLTKTKFNDKIPSGVPENIKVAHKIGVFDEDKTSLPVYSDCGIFYVPNRPYSLCITTTGMDEQTARQNMQVLSKMAYGYIEKVN